MNSQRLGLLPTADENAENLHRLFNESTSLEDMLSSADMPLPIFSSNISALEQKVLLDKTLDIDGIVIELETFKALHLFCGQMHIDVQRNWTAVFHKIKKHVILSDYTNEGIICLKCCHGLTIFRDSGYEIVLCLLPLVSANDADLHAIKLNELQQLFFKEFKLAVENKCENASPRDKSRPTLRKNLLSDVSFWNIMPQDKYFILNILDEAIAATKLPPGSRTSLLVCQFGQKCEDAVDLDKIVDINQIHRISIHSAVTMSMSSYDVHLMWSRSGLEELVRSRGTMFSVLTLNDAANYQSNLNSNVLDISHDLRNLLTQPHNLTFIQLYADHPHRHPLKCCSHPVSGSIANSGIMHHQTTSRLARDARSYIQTFNDNASKMSSLINARLEVVTVSQVNELPGRRIEASDFIKVASLSALLEKHPLVIPLQQFVSNIERPSSELLQSVASHLCRELEELHNKNKCRGGFLASWRAYQLELSLEKYFFGKPTQTRDAIYSTNLGPGSLSDVRSATTRRGFLCLESPTTCAVDACSPPPLEHWTSNKKEQVRLKRIFGFSDCLDASYATIGANLLTCLLYDVKNASLPSSAMWSCMRAADRPTWAKLISGHTQQSLSLELATTMKKMHYPHVTQRCTVMLTEKHIDISSVISHGLDELQLKYFPHIKVYDAARHSNINWNNRDIVEILRPGEKSSIDTIAAEITGDTILHLESNNFCFERHLKHLKEATVLPWMSPILKKLDGQFIGEEKTKLICLYLTCIAMLQNGLYMDYNKLANLDIDIGQVKAKLKQLEILSPFVIPYFNRCALHRLHKTIPWKLRMKSNDDHQPKRRRTQQSEQQEVQHEADALHDESGDEGEQRIIRQQRRHVPTSKAHGRWSGEELCILGTVCAKGCKTCVEAYHEYIGECLRQTVPYRSNKAFEFKYAQFMRDK